MKLHLSNEVETDEADRSFASGARHALIPGALGEIQRERMGETALRAFRAALLETFVEDETVVEFTSTGEMAASLTSTSDCNERIQEQLAEPADAHCDRWYSFTHCTELMLEDAKPPI